MLRSRRAGGTLAGFLVLAVVVAALLWGFGGLRELPPGWRFDKTRTAAGLVTRVETPLGGVEVQRHDRLDPAKLGVPVYPGAEIVDHSQKAATVEFESGRQRSGVTLVAGLYKTRDEVETVRRFYQQELPHWMVTPDGIELVGKGYRRMVLLRRKGGETLIAVASIGEPASN